MGDLLDDLLRVRCADGPGVKQESVSAGVDAGFHGKLHFAINNHISSSGRGDVRRSGGGRQPIAGKVVARV